MATQFCQKCKQVHPGRVCGYDEEGEGAETVEIDKALDPPGEASKDEESER